MGVIVVTGCNGRIGSRAVARFADAGFQVVGFDIVAPKNPHPKLDFRQIDLSSDKSVKEGFDYIRSKYGNKIVSVIHLAAYYSFAKGSWKKYEQITVKGTGRMLAAAKTFECEQFLFSSTQLVHAPCKPGELITEDSPLLGSWDYPRSKIETEALMMREHGNVPIVILRIVGCYDDECHSIPLSNQMQRIYEKQLSARLFPGDVTHGAPFMHLDDLTDALWLSVDKRTKLPKETVMLIGEPDTLSTDELQRGFSRLMHGTEFKTIRIPQWFAMFGAWAQQHTPFMDPPFIQPWMIPLADDHYQIDISRAEMLLGWRPKKSLRTMLPSLVDYLKSDPLRFYQVNDLKAPKWLKRKYGK
jgi:nucleoside-diphosphate-sugar epimerase